MFNIQNRVVKKVNKVELLNSLKTTLEQNTKAIDNVTMWIHSCEDRLAYNEEDFEAQDALETLKYIEFSLRYLDKQYMDCYRKSGGKL